ncbi:hypothetical protein C2I17_09705 [Niallia circulans]|uniref:hypothetical protein n=1 Tax=Niallia circulans TaxID=1397 RepID=UPI00201DEAF2|nr:hypothetical protein [Niallia circulans]UQZ74818.1 hypothetical protein C2I17_09705 [Niallia circulans]
MKFVFFNDTGRLVKIHPATFHGCITKKEPIKHLEEREFILPEGTFAWTKMWDYEEFGLSILVTPMVDKK